MVRRGRHGVVPAAVAVAAVLAAAGCTGQPRAERPSSPAASPSVDTTLAAKVPDPIASTRTIVVATDPRYAPGEFRGDDGKSIVGFDIDLFNAVAARLGLTPDWQAADFGDIVPGVIAGRYQIGISSFPINPDREQQVTMVSYFTAGTQWAAPAGATLDPAHPCGAAIAVQADTVQVADVTARSQDCVAAGEPPVTVHQYPKQDDVTAAVLRGTDAAMLADSPVTGYAVKQSGGKLALLGPVYRAVPYGFVLPRDETDFAATIAAAVRGLIEDGTYRAILERWGVQAGALTTPPAVDPPVPTPTPSAG